MIWPATQQHELAEVIGVVVGCHEELAEHRLSRPVRDLRVEIDGRIAGQLRQGVEVGAELRHALVPRLIVRRRGSLRPVAGGEVGRHVLGVARELEDVPLSEAEVLQDFPRRVGEALRPGAAQSGGEVLHRRVEVDVGMVALEKLGHEVFTECFVIAGHSFLLGLGCGVAGVARLRELRGCGSCGVAGLRGCGVAFSDRAPRFKP